jgi:hypothetical protein
MAAPKPYEITFKSARQWVAAELEHVGRIAAVMDPDIQYSYAMSTLNGMAHLKDALYELVTDPEYEHHKADLQRTHDAVVRTMKHLKKEYNLDLDAIRAFNTKGTLSDLGYLEDLEDLEEDVGNMEYSQNRQGMDGGKRRRTRYRSRRSRLSRKSRKSHKSRKAY